MIAFSQINQILTVSLSTRFHTKFQQATEEDEAPKVSTLNKQILIINASNLVIDLATAIYFGICFNRIHGYYSGGQGEEADEVFR